jgi:hypothetical protein
VATSKAPANGNGDANNGSGAEGSTSAHVAQGNEGPQTVAAHSPAGTGADDLPDNGQEVVTASSTGVDSADTLADVLMPEVVGMMGGTLPPEWSRMEANWQGFLGNMRCELPEWAVPSTPIKSASYVVMATLTVVALEVARRRLTRPQEELQLFEVTDGRVSGLRYTAVLPHS